MSEEPEIEVCPLCSVWPTGVYLGTVECCNPNCPLHGVAIPLQAWNMLAALAGYTDTLRRAWNEEPAP